MAGPTVTTKKLIVGISPGTGLKQYTVPAGLRATMVAYLWGAGGGAGGDDSPGIGGNGACGQLIKVTVDLAPGDVVGVGIGKAGLGGSSGAGSAAGGAGGQGPGDASISFAGGRGGRAGTSGSSGGGGGGGGATVLAINGVEVAVAGGGGGGGGGGNVGSVNGLPATNTGSTQASNRTGMNGEDRSGDGGGGGGGGGGRFGGRGGDLTSRSGDQGGTAGETGASWRDTERTESGLIYAGLSVNPSKGDSAYDPGTYAKGGVASGNTAQRAGGDGYAVIEFEYIPLPKFKGAEGWQQITNAYVKFAESWKPIINTWVKVGTTWKPVSPIGNVSFGDTGTGIVSGGTRAFSSYV
jgi:hypothetical protein